MALLDAEMLAGLTAHLLIVSLVGPARGPLGRVSRLRIHTTRPLCAAKIPCGALTMAPCVLFKALNVPELWEVQCESATSTRHVANDTLPPRAHRLGVRPARARRNQGGGVPRPPWT